MTVNLHADEWDESSDAEGWSQRERSLRKPLGASLVGATLYELDPGSRICPYHYHYGEEEWLLLVTGTVTVRRPVGELVLREGDVIVFRRGPDGGHDVRNNGDAPARVLIFSNRADPEVCVYPDSGKVGAWAGDTIGHKLHLMNRVESNLDYMEGEE